jgi:hypothetical protein
MAKKKRSRRKASSRDADSTQNGQIRQIRSESRTAYNLAEQTMESALLSSEHRQLLETYYGEEAYLELQELARQAGSRAKCTRRCSRSDSAWNYGVETRISWRLVERHDLG